MLGSKARCCDTMPHSTLASTPLTGRSHKLRRTNIAVVTYTDRAAATARRGARKTAGWDRSCSAGSATICGRSERRAAGAQPQPFVLRPKDVSRGRDRHFRVLPPLRRWDVQAVGCGSTVRHDPSGGIIAGADTILPAPLHLPYWQDEQSERCAAGGHARGRWERPCE